MQESRREAKKEDWFDKLIRPEREKYDAKIRNLDQLFEELSDEEVTDQGDQTKSDHQDKPLPLIRFLHVSVDLDTTPFTVYMDGRKVIDEISYLAHSSYIEVPVGEHVLEIYGGKNREKLLFYKRFEVDLSKQYTIAWIDDKQDSQGLQMLTFEDDSTKLANKARVRLVHLSPDTLKLNVALRNRGKIFSNVSYKEASTYRTLQPGTVQVDVQNAKSNSRIMTIPNVTLSTNTVQLWVAVNTMGELNLLVLEG